MWLPAGFSLDGSQWFVPRWNIRSHVRKRVLPWGFDQCYPKHLPLVLGMVLST